MAVELNGRNCIVTGGASGIGAATAELFAELGARVVVADIDAEGAAEVAKGINERFPGSAASATMDAGSPADTSRVIELCESTFGPLHVFFANAGIMAKRTPVEEEDEDAFVRTLRVNTLGAFHAVKRAGAAMARHGQGSIVCTSSIAGIRADVTPLSYAASKGAVKSLVISGSDRFLGTGVRVNGVMPGGVLTPLAVSVARGLEERGEQVQHDIHRFPLIDPREIANAVAFLASDSSSAVKGHVLVVDNGKSNSIGNHAYPKPRANQKQAHSDTERRSKL